MKILGGILVISACTYMGIFMGSFLRKRSRLLLQLQSCAMLLKAQIRHERTPLPDALYRVGKSKEGVIGEMFCSISNQLLEYGGVTTEEVWRNAIENYLLKTELTAEDRETLLRLGERIGVMDAAMQEEVLNVYIEEVDNTLAILAEEIRQKTGFYRMMGVLAGIFITIILL